MAPMPPSQVIVLTKEAMRDALLDRNQQAGDTSVGSDVKFGLTINLSHKSIQKLPEEVVDIIRDKLER